MFSLSAFVCFLVATASGLPMSLPTFEWIQGDPIHKAALKITFPNGKSDIALLNSYNPIPSIQRSDLCIFNGYLKEESDAHVTLAGCPNSENFEIMLRSRHLADFMFRISFGNVEAIKPLLGSTTINRDGLQVTYKDEAVELKGQVLTKNMDNTRQLSDQGYRMKVKVRYDDGFKKKFGAKTEETIARVMAFAQDQFKLPSLTTTIDLDISAPEYVAGTFNAAKSEDLAAVAAMSKDPAFNAYVYLVCSEKSAGTLGVAYTGTTCGDDVTGRTSLNEWEGSDLNTGLTVAHEMGHNLGMQHDFGAKGQEDIRNDKSGKPCTKIGGIMDYNPPFKVWSTCSVEDFRDYVASLKPTAFCLPVNGNSAG